jgi:hypothetical protein
VTGREEREDAELAPDDAGRSVAPEAPPVGDDAAAALAREVYWAGDGVSRRPDDVGSLAERLDAYTHQMRVAQRQLVPAGETLFGSAARWKHTVKLFIWRSTRFSTMRYDRLLADLAEMNGELARRLLETEEELARLREDLDRRGGPRS